MRDDSDSSEPSFIMLVELMEEAAGHFFDNLLVCFLCFLILANEGSKFRSVVSLDLLGSGHLVPILGYTLDFDWHLQLVDLLPIISVFDCS